MVDDGANGGSTILLPYKQGILIVSPRMDIVKMPSYELFLLSEHSFAGPASLRLVARIQAITNVNAKHYNKGYQLIRVGVEKIISSLAED